MLNETGRHGVLRTPTHRTKTSCPDPEGTPAPKWAQLHFSWVGEAGGILSMRPVSSFLFGLDGFVEWLGLTSAGKEAEASFLFLFGHTSCIAGHLADGGGNGGVLEDDGRGHALGATGGGVVIGNPPLGGASERLGDQRLVGGEGFGRVAVEDDLEAAVVAGEEPGDQSICVAELGNADLGDQIND